jgi:LuxR family transcriptional activator of conjugal transfer of Ti plasmids
MNAWFTKLLDLTALPGNLDQIFDGLDQLTKEGGFAYFCHLKLKSEIIDYQTNLPPCWQNAFLSERQILQDPEVIKARRRVIYSWSEQKKSKNLTEPMKTMNRVSRELGIRSGVTVPIATGFGHQAMLSLYSKSKVPKDISNTDPVLAATAVAQLHIRLKHARTQTTTARLNPKETRCLRWIAEGKSISVVADLEGLSYGGVRFVIQNAKEALGAVSLAQATAAAKERQLI